MSNEKQKRAAIDRVAARIKSESARRGKPQTFDQARAKARETAIRYDRKNNGGN